MLVVILTLEAPLRQGMVARGQVAYQMLWWRTECGRRFELADTRAFGLRELERNIFRVHVSPAPDPLGLSGSASGGQIEAAGFSAPAHLKRGRVSSFGCEAARDTCGSGCPLETRCFARGDRITGRCGRASTAH